MDAANLQRIIAETDAAYAMGQSKGGETGVWMMQNAVANRDAAIRSYEASKSSAPASTSSPTYSTTYSAPPPPAPVYPKFKPITGQTKNVLVAPSDIIQFDNENVDIALMQDLLFEDIAAIELANISRSDLIDGQEVVYSPIKNLSSIRRKFNPNNIIVTANSNDYFSRFGIDIFSKTIYEPYFNEDGDLVIEIDGVLDGEEIEVQILSNGTIDLVDDV